MGACLSGDSGTITVVGLLTGVLPTSGWVRLLTCGSLATVEAWSPMQAGTLLQILVMVS